MTMVLNPIRKPDARPKTTSRAEGAHRAATGSAPEPKPHRRPNRGSAAADSAGAQRCRR